MEQALSSWPTYWIYVLIAGTLGAGIYWFVGGWWYKKRLQWSGAPDASPSVARRVYAYQDMVVSAPVVLITAIQTFLFANYREAWQAAPLWSGACVVFAFWSCWTSYAAAMTAFPVVKRKAMLWCIGLPVLYYFAVLGLFAALYALFGAGAS
jgi:hypothetical protein